MRINASAFLRILNRQTHLILMYVLSNYVSPWDFKQSIPAQQIPIYGLILYFQGREIELPFHRLFSNQAVSIFLLKRKNWKPSMHPNKMQLYCTGVTKQVLNIICDNEIINIFLYLKNCVPKVNEIKIVHIK